MAKQDLRAFAKFTNEQKAKIAEKIRDGTSGLSPEEMEQLKHEWRFWARPTQVAPDGDWDVLLYLAGRGTGKANDIDSEIPTVSGWTKLGSLSVGDSVLDEYGRPCRVTFATEVMLGRPCYDVVFSDGSIVVADAEHLWQTVSDGIVSVVTTETIRESAKEHKVARPCRMDELAIREVRKRPSVPVRCIQVDSPNHLFLIGRSFIPTHNTRSMIEWLRERIQQGSRYVVIAGATAPSIRNIIIDGPSGILANSPKHERPQHFPSMSRLVWPNGAKAELISAEEPDRFRGPQCDTAICDELASWYGAETEDINSENLAWNQLRLGCRLGSAYGMSPKIFVATTPRPTPLIISIRDDPSTVVLVGRTFENAANLAPSYLRAMQKQYGGTRLGRQELEGEVLEEAKGALWKSTEIEKFRIKSSHEMEYIRSTLTRIVVAIDPAVSSKKTSDKTGIIVAGTAGGHYYILEDHSGTYSPEKWARKAIDAYGLNRADRIIAEKNNGGDLVEHTLRTISRNVPFTAVSASRGKATRAEPIAALSEQGRVHMMGFLPDLEKQLVNWNPQSGTASPDRLDAMVWAVWALMGGTTPYRSMGTIEAV